LQATATPGKPAQHFTSWVSPSPFVAEHALLAFGTFKFSPFQTRSLLSFSGHRTSFSRSKFTLKMKLSFPLLSSIIHHRSFIDGCSFLLFFIEDLYLVIFFLDETNKGAYNIPSGVRWNLSYKQNGVSEYLAKAIAVLLLSLTPMVLYWLGNLVSVIWLISMAARYIAVSCNCCD
jgi:hypothetical protein